MINPLKTDNPVTNTLNAVVEQAIQDYLFAKLYLYRLEKNEAKLLGTIRRIQNTPEGFKSQCEKILEECIEFFNEGDFKALYDNRSGDEVIEALNKRFTNEVIPTYEKTGTWSYNKGKEAESE